MVGRVEANVHDISVAFISWIKGTRTMLPTVALRVLDELYRLVSGFMDLQTSE